MIILFANTARVFSEGNSLYFMLDLCNYHYQIHTGLIVVHILCICELITTNTTKNLMQLNARSASPCTASEFFIAFYLLFYTVCYIYYLPQKRIYCSLTLACSPCAASEFFLPFIYFIYLYYLAQ